MDLTEVVRTPSSPCPYCGKHLNRAATIDQSDRQSIPQPNDWTVCCHCAQVLIFDTDLAVRKPHDRELHAIRATPANAAQMDFFVAVVRGMDRRPPPERKHRNKKRSH